MQGNNANPGVTIFNKQNVFFTKTGNRKVKQFLSGGWYQWEGEYKERV
jgi:hypothetical protein